MRTVLTKSEGADGATIPSKAPLVAVVDDDQSVREALEKLLGKVLASAEGFISPDHLGQSKCIILDMHMPGMSGLEHKARLVLLTLTPPHDRKH